MNKFFIILLLICIFFLSFLIPAAADNFSALFLKASPSVVMIETVEHAKPSIHRISKETVFSGLGSGVVISKDGLIMTAAHVVHVADAVMVHFSNGKKITAEVVGSVQAADVALLRLDDVPPNLAVAPLGSSKKTLIGDEIFIIGAPYGISQTLTIGHISGKRTPEKLSAQLVPIEFLQTDASINKGNSGGPMFNMDGEVVGIVSSILSKSGGFEGIGFAASIDNAKELLLVKKPFWTGLEFLYVKDDMAKAINLPQEAGILIQRVADFSPGYRLGFKSGKIPARILNSDMVLGGDIILKVNDIPISCDMESLNTIRNLITEHPELKNIEFTVLRDGKPIVLLKK